MDDIYLDSTSSFVEELLKEANAEEESAVNDTSLAMVLKKVANVLRGDDDEIDEIDTNLREIFVGENMNNDEVERKREYIISRIKAQTQIPVG